jgi:hypothetical protein
MQIVRNDAEFVKILKLILKSLLSFLAAVAVLNPYANTPQK